MRNPYKHCSKDPAQPKIIFKKKKRTSGESTCSVGDLGVTPGLGRSPEGGHDNPLQYFCLENPMDRETWWATVHGVAKTGTRLSNLTQHSTAWHHILVSDRTLFGKYLILSSAMTRNFSTPISVVLTYLLFLIIHLKVCFLQWDSGPDYLWNRRDMT